jgi:hypothetical protein
MVIDHPAHCGAPALAVKRTLDAEFHPDGYTVGSTQGMLRSPVADDLLSQLRGEIEHEARDPHGRGSALDDGRRRK